MHDTIYRKIFLITAYNRIKFWNITTETEIEAQKEARNVHHIVFAAA